MEDDLGWRVPWPCTVIPVCRHLLPCFLFELAALSRLCILNVKHCTLVPTSRLAELLFSCRNHLSLLINQLPARNQKGNVLSVGLCELYTVSCNKAVVSWTVCVKLVAFYGSSNLIGFFFILHTIIHILDFKNPPLVNLWFVYSPCTLIHAIQASMVSYEMILFRYLYFP